MQWFRNPQAMAIVSGPRGSGKSWFMKETVRGLPRVLVIDTLEEYEVPYFRDVQGADAWFAERRPSRFRVGLRVPREEVNRAMLWSWSEDVRPVVVACEETDLYAPPNAVEPGLQYMVNYGRRFGLGGIFSTRRPFALDRQFTANAQYLVLFPTPEPRDRTFWQEYVPAELTGKIWCHLDSAKTAGYCAVVDVRARTCQLVTPAGVVEPSGEPEKPVKSAPSPSEPPPADAGSEPEAAEDDEGEPAAE